MGGIMNKSHQQKLSEDIYKLNQICQNELFYKKTGKNINFTCNIEELNFLKKLFFTKIIEVEIKNVDKGEFEVEDINKYPSKSFDANFPSKQSIVTSKSFTITPKEFYTFYNTILDCMSVFYEHSIFKSTIKIREKEEELCCICEERRSDVMLECYHFFCEKCIETWLFKKLNSCPLCRVRVSIENPNKKREEKTYWNVIEKDQIDPEEYFEEMRQRLKLAIDYMMNKE